MRGNRPRGGNFPLTRAGQIPIFAAMEQLIAEIEDYARRAGIKPGSVLRSGINASSRQWQEWVDGKSSPTMATVDRLRAWMATNPPAAGLRAGERLDDLSHAGDPATPLGAEEGNPVSDHSPELRS